MIGWNDLRIPTYINLCIISLGIAIYLPCFKSVFVYLKIEFFALILSWNRSRGEKNSARSSTSGEFIESLFLTFNHHFFPEKHWLSGSPATFFFPDVHSYWLRSENQSFIHNQMKKYLPLFLSKKSCKTVRCSFFRLLWQGIEYCRAILISDSNDYD